MHPFLVSLVGDFASSVQVSGGTSDAQLHAESFTRWIHVWAGVVWIGHLYFFNFVNANVNAKLDGPTKKLVVPQLMPRALFWFRWGAAITFLSGLLLFFLVYMQGSNLKDAEGNLSNRAIWIMAGMTMGLIMAFNVWVIIWPAQRQIIPKIRDGVAPDAALVKRATLASKLNTYLSVPLIATMLSQHFALWLGQPGVYIPVVIVVGFAAVWLWYKAAPKVQGM